MQVRDDMERGGETGAAAGETGAKVLKFFKEFSEHTNKGSKVSLNGEPTHGAPSLRNKQKNEIRNTHSFLDDELKKMENIQKMNMASITEGLRKSNRFKGTNLIH